MIETFKDILVTVTQTGQENAFYYSPLELIRDVISKVDFSSFECDVSLLKTIVGDIVTANKENLQVFNS